MTRIRIVYDPFAKRVSIYNEDEEFSAAENKICAFLNNNSFYDCLLPMRKRYLIWNGLLPELMSEVNDDELQIVFEGRTCDYQRVDGAFRHTAGLCAQLGYENRWNLCHAGNFEAAHLVNLLDEVAKDLREMCESRAELSQVDHVRLQLAEQGPDAVCLALSQLIAGHIGKWEAGNSPYREEKITYLKILCDRLEEVEKHLGKHVER